MAKGMGRPWWGTDGALTVVMVGAFMIFAICDGGLVS